MSQPESGAVSRRPHHISSIAHLFLQDEPAVRDLEEPHGSVEVVVASPGETPATALAAAGLTVGAPEGASLLEDARMRWSAATYFRQEEEMPELQEIESPFPAKRWERGTRRRRTINCCHLGCLREEKLAHLEAMAGTRSLGDTALARVDTLVWCLLHKEVGLMRPAYLLGRLAELLRPPEIRVLVFPDAWARAGLPGWLDEIHAEETSRWSFEVFNRIREQTRLVCGEVPVKAEAVGGVDNLARGLAARRPVISLWRRLAEEMTGDGSSA